MGIISYFLLCGELIIGYLTFEIPKHYDGQDVEEYDSINLNKLYSKTASLKYLKYKYLRETILKDCMPLVESVFKEV